LPQYAQFAASIGLKDEGEMRDITMVRLWVKEGIMFSIQIVLAEADCLRPE
jgi:hypothetical protein